MFEVGFTFRQASLEECIDISTLESLSYPHDEAATPDKIKYRIENARNFFYVLRNSENVLVGFINGTCVRETTIHHESMSHHVGGGRTLVIHSVVISPTFRHHKFGVRMVQEYLKALHKSSLVDRVLLLSKAYLLHFYLMSGFKVICLSNVVHGEVLPVYLC